MKIPQQQIITLPYTMTTHVTLFNLSQLELDLQLNWRSVSWRPD